MANVQHSSHSNGTNTPKPYSHDIAAGAPCISMRSCDDLELPTIRHRSITSHGEAESCVHAQHDSEEEEGGAVSVSVASVSGS